MLKTIWMSDLHFSHEGDVLGHDPRAHLRAAIAHINTHHGDAAQCIISGDMVNRGTDADYQALRQELDALTIPYAPMMGNHDDQKLFRAHLPLPNSCMADFIQYPLAADNALLLCLDTHEPGHDSGEFCAARTEWLAETLNQANGLPVYLFLHHPPMALGLPMQDTDRMADGEAFLDLISQAGNVRYLFIGHVHRPISGTIRGIPFSTMRSVLFQAPAPRPAWDWTSFKPAQEAPNIGVLTITGGDVNLQYEQIGGLGLSAMV